MELMEEAEGIQEVEPYPDNVQIIAVFDRMLTQWHEGASGVRGLRYEALPHIPIVKKLNSDEYEEVFEGLRVMELAALAKIREDQSDGS